jgi:hypothetical protein
MADQKRTCDLILAVGDGNLGEVRGMQYSDSVVNVFDDRNMRPTNASWHFLIPQMIYWGMVCVDCCFSSLNLTFVLFVAR